MLRMCAAVKRRDNSSLAIARRWSVVPDKKTFPYPTAIRSFHLTRGGRIPPLVVSTTPAYQYAAPPVVGYVVGCCSSWYWNSISRTFCDDDTSSNSMVRTIPQDQIPETTSEKIRHLSGWKKVRRKIRRAWKMLARFVKLYVTLFPVVACYPLLLLTMNKRDPDQDAQAIVLAGGGGDDDDQTQIKGLMKWYLNMCLRCVEYSGAAVIKLMQWAGSRPDLFGHEFCTIFSKLQDHTTPHRWKHTERKMREAYGDNWQEKLTLHELLGSGCIGQVYRGEVRDEETGQVSNAAVKVLHPNVDEDIDADLDLMRLFVKTAERLPFEVFSNMKWLNLNGVVEEFAALLKIQLDLRKEASNLQRFNENFKNDETIIFPKLIKGYEPTRHILVESYVEGIPVFKFARQHAHEPEVLRAMCRKAIRAVCKMIFLDNFMHGDLHPGNVFVSKDGKDFILFDVGIVAEYTDQDHELIVDILSAFIRHDGRKAGRLMIDDSNDRMRKNKTDEKALEEEKYIDKIEALTVKASGTDYLMENLGDYITYICNAAAKHHIMMNPAFVSAALAIKVQEGIALALDPATEVWKVASPIIVQSERQRQGVVKATATVLGIKDWYEWIFGGGEKSNDTS